MVNKQLRVWVMPSLGGRTSDYLSRQVQPFLRKHPGVDIEWRFCPYPRAWQELIRSFKAGSPPDVFQIASHWGSSLAHFGFLAQVPKGIGNRSLVAPWVGDAVKSGGNRVAVPWLIESFYLAADMGVLEECGIATPPTTAAGVLEACRRIQGKGAFLPEVEAAQPVPVGFIWYPEANVLHNALPWFRSFGWDYPSLTRTQEAILSDAKAIEAWMYLRRLRATNSTDSNSDSRAFRQFFGIEREFCSGGRYGFHIGLQRLLNREALSRFQGNNDLSPSIDIGRFKVLRWPIGPGGSITRGAVASWGVASGTKNASLSWELVQHLVSDDFLYAWSGLCGDPPAFEGKYWQEADDPHFRAVRATISSVSAYPAHPLWMGVSQILSKGLWEIISAPAHARPDQLVTMARNVDAKVNQMLQLAWDVPARPVRIMSSL